MIESLEGFPRVALLVAAGVMLALLFVGCPRDGPDTELARPVREAVELARLAQADDRSAVLWSGRFRLLALIIGVSAPIVVAYLIWRSSTEGEIDPVEVIETIEKYNLPASSSLQGPALPTGSGVDQEPPRHVDTHSLGE